VRALLPPLLLLSGAACEPSLELARYAVTIAEVERCTVRGGAAETCEEPEAATDTIPVLIETVGEVEVTLYAADPETGDERAFRGLREGDRLALARALERIDEESGCQFARQSDLALELDGGDLNGTERVLTEESAGCNALGLETFTRVERAWRGQLDDE